MVLKDMISSAFLPSVFRIYPCIYYTAASLVDLLASCALRSRFASCLIASFPRVSYIFQCELAVFQGSEARFPPHLSLLSLLRPRDRKI